MPKISVIIPVYNNEKYLEKCLESILDQTFKDIEIICINDGSTDGSLDILEKYSVKDKRIIIINKNNEGSAVARNLGIKTALGEYISFVDSDDYLGNNEYYSVLYNKAKEKNADIVKCTYKFESSNSIAYFINSEIKKDKNAFCIEFCSAIFKTDFLHKNKIFFPRLNDMEDPVFAFRCALLANNVEIINDVSYIVVNNQNSITRRKIPEKQINEKIDGLELIIQMANNANLSSECYIYVTALWFSIIYRDILRKSKNIFIRQRALKRMCYLWKTLKLTDELKNKIKDNNSDCYVYFTKPAIIRFCMNFAKNLFSIMKSPDGTHRIITVCGIKIKLKKENHTQKNYEKVLKRIRKSNKKIRVLFYVTENQKWCYQSLYEILANSEIFEPFIVVSVLTSVHNGNDSSRNNIEENYEFFKTRGMNVKYGYKNGAYINLKEFTPDIIFYEQQWEIPKTHRPHKVSKYALTCYCPYGLSLFEYGEDYSYGFNYQMFKNFIDSEINIERFEKNIKGASKNCIATGYSKLDTYFDEQVISSEKYWKDPDKIKIIYAPHHSFEDKGICAATFKENGRFILDLAKKYPETTWIFKPHPRFKFALLQNNVMTEKEIEAYYTEWKEVGRIYTQGDYFDIFKSSDFMVTDCCSFLAEYLPTGKPLIRMLNPKVLSLNELGEKVVEGYYQTKNNTELKEVFENLLTKNDVKKDIRKASAKYVLKEIKSSEKIFEIVKEWLV